MLLYATLLSTHSAHALSCFDGPSEAYPPDGEQQVPLNAVPRVTLSSTEVPLLLVDSSGREVPIQPQRVENPGGIDMLYLMPDDPLLPDTTYTLSAGETEEYGASWTVSTFTTGSEATTTPPQAPLLDRVERDRGHDSWGPWDWLIASLQIDDSSGRHPGTFLVEISDSEDFTNAQRVEVFGWEELGEWQVMVGSGPCSGAIVLERDQGSMRVALAGPDGQISDFSEGISARGCSAAPAAPTASMALLAFLLGAVGRVRRRR